jgi:hypothetical protein
MRKANHYVAQSYQARFCDNEGLIWVFDKETKRVNPQPPKTTAVITHLYTTETTEGEKTDIVERKIFEPLDGDIIPLISRWIEPGYHIPNADIPQMAYFLAFQHARVPRTLAMFRELGEMMHIEFVKHSAADKKGMDEAYERFAKDAPADSLVTREQYQDWFAEFDKYWKFKLKDEFVLAMCVKCVVPNYYETLTKMHWCIVDAPRDGFFITCDAPVVSVAPAAPGAIHLGCCTASPDFEVNFPLSPKVCVLIRKVKGQQRFRCSAKYVNLLNYRTALMAERYIFSHRDSAKVRSLMDRGAKTRQQPKIDKEYVRSRMAYEKSLGII